MLAKHNPLCYIMYINNKESENKMTFINMKSPYARGVETVDEFITYREAREMLKEYRMSDPSGNYYLSQRSTKEWSER